MDSYIWSVSGNGSITAGGTLTDLTVTVTAGNTCDTYTVNLTINKNTSSTNCSQFVSVTDNQPPTFTAPEPFSLCVEDIIDAVYSDLPYPDDLTYPRPDYFQFVKGDTDFNLTVSSFSDNCCTPTEDDITWKIETLSGDPVANGTGQPSTHADFKIPGNDLTEVVYRITWWIKDCHNQLSAPITRDITILPRPFIELQY